MTRHRGEHPSHETCVETTTFADLAQGNHSYVCGPDCPPKTDLRPQVTTYEEWRVTGTWDGERVQYDFSPTKSPGIDPETGARQVAAQIVGNLLGWTDGPHLHKRTVTATDWDEVDT